MKFILGSGSQSRRKYFAKLGYEFEVMIPDVDEQKIRHTDPKILTMQLARAKADALLKKIKEPAILITADQVVWWDKRILEKPKNAQEVREFLRGYEYSAPQPINGIVVTNTKTSKRATGNDVNTVYFSPLSQEIIEKLIQEGNVYSWAGAFSLDEPLLKSFVERIEGTLDSIEGLPLMLTKQLIEEVFEL